MSAKTHEPYPRSHESVLLALASLGLLALVAQQGLGALHVLLIRFQELPERWAASGGFRL